MKHPDLAPIQTPSSHWMYRRCRLSPHTVAGISPRPLLPLPHQAREQRQDHPVLSLRAGGSGRASAGAAAVFSSAHREPSRGGVPVPCWWSPSSRWVAGGSVARSSPHRSPDLAAGQHARGLGWARCRRAQVAAVRRFLIFCCALRHLALPLRPLLLAM